jgi:DNA-binding transcriptional MerR regulator
MVRKKIQEKLIRNPIWLLISEAAKLAGVSDKTIRRAVKDIGGLRYRIINGRYYVELLSVIEYLERSTKLSNRLNTFGLGQYVKEFNRKRSEGEKKNKEEKEKVDQEIDKKETEDK